MEKISILEYEAEMAKMERKSRRLIIAIMIMVGALFASNVFWFIHLFG